jgi:hypothetical protein
MDKRHIPILVIVSALLFMTVVPGQAAAGTSTNGRIWTIPMTLNPDTYNVHAGNITAGEKTAFAITSDGPIDVFVFNQSEYDQYKTTGIVTPGYEGPAHYTAFATTSSEAILTAETSGTYYLVLDNTPAGLDPGTSQRNAVLKIVYPLSAIVTDALVLLGVMLLILAIVFIAVIAFSIVPTGTKRV